MKHMMVMTRSARAVLVCASLWATLSPAPALAHSNSATMLEDSPAATAPDTAGSSLTHRGTPHYRHVVVEPDSTTIADLSRRVAKHRIRAYGTFGRVELHRVSFTDSGVSGVLHPDSAGTPDSLLHLSWSDVDQVAVAYSSALNGLQKGAIIGATPGWMMITGEPGDDFVRAIMRILGPAVLAVGGVAGGLVGTGVGFGIVNWTTLYISPYVSVDAGRQDAPRVIATVRHKKRDTSWDRAVRTAVGQELVRLGYDVVDSDAVREVLRGALGEKEARQAERSEPTGQTLRLIREHTAADAVLLLDVLDSPGTGAHYVVRLLETTAGEQIMRAEVFVPVHHKRNLAQVTRCLTTGALMYLAVPSQADISCRHDQPRRKVGPGT